MDNREETKPKLTDAGKARQSSREAQRAEALRANLLRRKTQARGRAEGGDHSDHLAEKPGDG
jgi:hypothetical protein